MLGPSSWVQSNQIEMKTNLIIEVVYEVMDDENRCEIGEKSLINSKVTINHKRLFMA